MGSCVSRSPASGSGRAVATAKVVGLDGSMTQYSAPVTAGEALGDDNSRKGASVFLCSSDELRFDEPPRALADEEALQPGWLYFVLPVSMLRLALSGHEMAALAVRASSALAVASGVASPPRRKIVPGANGKTRKTARVAPLVVAPNNDEDAELADSGSSLHPYGKYGASNKTVRGGGHEKAGKTRKIAGYRSRGARHRRRAADVPRLSAILEDDDF
ncbi:uncharacterized protein LOC124651689 [Lolium rigidum]|uniref:uncharacterized protein LOC124651689 n=1 Tax=Lolium rigidum TaxID=89674 RepID=UPI001F5C3042|nr:uncharacterized protein LOC124651689 [Lolium rigidum]XP_051188507.1 uncharacterized protein LOC127302149 [Lolium perenne]